MRSDRRQRGFTSSWRSAEHGFTLIEVMVALAVFGLAALALIRLESATIRGAAALDGTILAQMVAQSVAVDAVTSAQPPVLGPTQGAMVEGGRNWTWTRSCRRRAGSASCASTCRWRIGGGRCWGG